MLWIEAALAFVLIMMILSTVVTVIIEAGHRLFRVRETGLKRLVEQLHQQLPAGSQFSRSAFVDHMTLSAFLLGRSHGLTDRIVNAQHLTRLSTEAFVSRLAHSKEGLALYQHCQSTGQPLSALLRHLLLQFDLIGAGASDYFKRHASLYALCVGTVLAFCFNIDAPQLFLRAMADPSALQHPVNWGSAPWQQPTAHWWQYVSWGCSVALSGLLIGLGGPFWFDAYRKLGLLAGLHKMKAEDAITPQHQTERNYQDWSELFEQLLKTHQSRPQDDLSQNHQSTTGTK